MAKDYTSVPTDILDPNKSTGVAPVQGKNSKGVDVTPDKALKESSYTRISGQFGAGTHGAYLVPFGYLEYLPNAKIRELKVDFNVKLEPLAHVLFDELDLRMYAVYVPNSAVWDNADKFYAQKEDNYLPAITSIPSRPMTVNQNFQISPTASTRSGVINSTLWRESIAYHYFGRDFYNFTTNVSLPLNFLLIRGFKKAFNYIFRDRIAQAEFIEYKGDTVTDAEFNSAIHFGYVNPATVVRFDRSELIGEWHLPRVPASQGYHNSYRASLLTSSLPAPPTVPTTLAAHVGWQQQIDEYRSQAQNVNLTDEEIIAELTNGKVARENMPYLIGEGSAQIHLSIQQQTSEGAGGLTLGADGAFSYNTGTIYLINSHFSAPRAGYIHYMLSVTSPVSTIMQNECPREFWKKDWNEFYRPSLSVIKDEPLFAAEVQGMRPITQIGEIQGYKTRKFSEYFRHGNFIRGDFPVNITWESNSDPTQPQRFNTSGWSAVPKILTSSDPDILPSKSDWTLMGSYEKSIIDGTVGTTARLDMTDITLRRVLLFQGSTTYDGTLNSGIDIFRRQSSQTFMIYGSVTVEIQQPIDERIKREIIGYGEE